MLLAVKGGGNRNANTQEFDVSGKKSIRCPYEKKIMIK